MNYNIEKKVEIILREIKSDRKLGYLIDDSIPIPRPFPDRIIGQIKLIILGQDPTVKKESSRRKITQVLNLDKKGSLKNYLTLICQTLGLSLNENIYATNYFKNFFVKPPTQIKEIDVFKEFPKFWLPLLKVEISHFPNVPIITLGEPILKSVIIESTSKKVRDYWGYRSDWKLGIRNEYDHIKPNENHLNRLVFPFPHQPSIGKQFYRENLKDYISYMRNLM